MKEKYVTLGDKKYYYLNNKGTLPEEYFDDRFKIGLSNCPEASRLALKEKQKKINHSKRVH